jgi:hypothetical protein
VGVHWRGRADVSARRSRGARLAAFTRGQAAIGEAVLPTGYRSPAFDAGDNAFATFDDTDGETFTDGTTFDDQIPGNSFTATATAGAASVTAVGDISALQVGDMLLIQGDRPQIVKVVEIDGSTVDFVPELKRSISGTTIAFGVIPFPVRLIGETPRVPFMSGRSEAFLVQFVEPY